MNILILTKKILTSRYLALILRFYIGGLFIYASMYKINYTAEFAETIVSYQMAPYWSVNIIAVFLPWVELISGILMILGIRVKSVSLIILFLMLLFTLGIGVNLLRDAPISCGCFHSLEDDISWQTLFRDIFWCILVIHVYLYDRVLHVEKKFSLSVKQI